MNKLVRTFGHFAAAVALAGMAAPAAFAQSVDGSDDVINIPADSSILKPADPNERSATATVNGAIITRTDVDQRVALFIAANGADKIPDEQMPQLRMQVFRNLIDETLQIQEAAAQEMAVTPDQVQASYDNLARQRFGQSPEELDAYLKSIGSSSQSLKRQIEGELAWNNLIRRNVSPFVNVSADEVNEMMARIKESRGAEEYRIGEIYLAATPETRDAVLANANRIVEQLKQGGSFVAFARQFSQSTTASLGGDLGWIRLEQLQSPQLEAVVKDLQPGQLAGPIEISGGFDIMLLIDKRQVGIADPRDAMVSLKQISLEFPQGVSEAKANDMATKFASDVGSLQGCADADTRATAFGAEVVTNQLAVRALPEALQSAILNLQVGQTTPPFGSLDEGVRVLMLCGRDAPAADAGPDFDTLMSQLEDDRIGKRAQRYLRDLRRDAVIEYH